MAAEVVGRPALGGARRQSQRPEGDSVLDRGRYQRWRRWSAAGQRESCLRLVDSDDLRLHQQEVGGRQPRSPRGLRLLPQGVWGAPWSFDLRPVLSQVRGPAGGSLEGSPARHRGRIQLVCRCMDRDEPPLGERGPGGERHSAADIARPGTREREHSGRLGHRGLQGHQAP